MKRSAASRAAPLFLAGTTAMLGGACSPAGALPADARLAKEPAVLLAHAREGFNAMPPMGQCNDCSEDDLRRLIGFMSRPR